MTAIITAATVTAFEAVWDALILPDGTPRDAIAQNALLTIHTEIKAAAERNAQLCAAIETSAAAAHDLRQQRDELAREINYTARRITKITRDEIAHFIGYTMLIGDYGNETAEDLLAVLIGEEDQRVSQSAINAIKAALDMAAAEIAEYYEPRSAMEDES